MSKLAAMLWTLPAAVAAGLFWVAVGQLAFVVSGADPFDLLSGRDVAASGLLLTLAIWIAGIIVYALLSRLRFRLESRRRGARDA